MKSPKRPARQPSDDTPVSVELAGLVDRATQRAPEATVVNRQASLSASDSSPLMSVQAELLQPEESSADLGPGEVIGEYRLIEPIGRGGFAHVYRAKHLVFGEDFAVIYGDFPDQRSALQSLAGLPDWITASRPLPRQVHSLRPP